MHTSRLLPAISLYGLALMLVLPSPKSAQCEVLKLVGPPPDPQGSWFGFSVALRDDLMAIGKPSPKQGSPGSIDLFHRVEAGRAWVLDQTLVASDGAEYDKFGYSLAVEDGTVVVGSPAKGSLGAKGAAYVFQRQSDGTWLQTAKLLPNDDASWTFGWAVDIEANRIAVGSKGVQNLSSGSGTVFIFEQQGSSWVKTAAIKPSISAAGDGFGASLDMDGERMVVGAPYEGTTVSPFEGLAFVFEHEAESGAWVEKAILSPSTLQDGDFFGRSVALDGDRVLVGAPQYSRPLPLSGAAFVFDLTLDAWTQVGVFQPADQVTHTLFGWSVDLLGTHAAIGARTDTTIAQDAGAVYLLEDLGSWTVAAKLHGSGIAAGDAFGNDVVLDGSRLLVGAPYLLADSSQPGGAFLFALDPSGPSLIADSSSISISQGGRQTFQLGACPENAGELYWLLGSATGTSPGVVWGGLEIPLNLDPYLLHTVNHPNSPPLATSLGVLDPWGKASASFSLPPGSDLSLAGLVVNHAYLVLDATTHQLESVSAPVPVVLNP